MPEATNPPVEAKVKAASVATYLGSVAALAVLGGVNDAHLVAALPNAVEPFVLGVIPALVALFAGWKAKHSPR